VKEHDTMPTTTTTDEQIRQLAHDWTQAEQRGDTGALEELTTSDFTLVGPLGFVLDKTAWLERYRSGALATHRLTFDELRIRSYGQTAVTIGRHTQQAEYRGHGSDGQFRATHVAIYQDGRWLLASIQLSPIGQPPSGDDADGKAR
jgi:ketosteroid isomerase-like protein